MMTRESIIRRARMYVGTPFHHQGRVLGEKGGIDCIGLIVCVARDLGQPVADSRNYPRFPDGVRLRKELESQLVKTDRIEPLPGDVVLFWVDDLKLPRHVGICTDRGFVHAFYDVKKTVETELGHWSNKIVAVYEYPNTTGEVPQARSQGAEWVANLVQQRAGGCCG